jgi:GT2 family glycosyltransferase
VTGAAAAKALTPQAYAETVGRHLRRHGAGDEVQVEPAAERGAAVTWRPRDPSEQIDVVIPSRDNGEDVRTFVASLRTLARRPSQLHLTVMDNGTVDPASLGALAQLGSQGVAVRRCDEPFNWSRLSNLGARASDSPLVVFANDDMSMLTRDWDDRLRGLLQRADVGAVGAKLLYPDNTIQHAGVLFGWQGKAIHEGLYEAQDAGGPGDRWRLRRRVSAVTGAFFAMRRSLFDELGGFDERRLAISYSDLDMSLKVRARGLAVLYAPELELTHYESKSRGLTHLSPAAAAVDAAELQRLEARWPGALDRDISVNPAWQDATLAFHLLKPPSAEAALRHLRASARSDPWRPETGPLDPI